MFSEFYLSGKITYQRKLYVVTDFPDVFNLDKVSGDEALSEVRIGGNWLNFLDRLTIGHDKVFDKGIWRRREWGRI